MTLQSFHRGTFHDLVVTLTSNEVLGVLDAGYIEDYAGQDGQVTMHHLPTDTRYPLQMDAVASDVPHEVFRGLIPLASLPDGDYAIEGRVRDIAGNATIMTAVSDPRGDEQVLPLGFAIVTGVGPSITVGPLRAMGGFSINAPGATLSTGMRSPSSFVVGEPSNEVYHVASPPTPDSAVHLRRSTDH